MDMYSTLTDLINRLDRPEISDNGIIAWGSPVPSFGDVSTARVATLGINPSNREFVDERGAELDGTERRFHTLRSLSIDSWEEADSTHVSLIMRSCREYFMKNPYDRWFRRLDELVRAADVSFYGNQPGACHLDLVPFATKVKWTRLESSQRKGLLDSFGDSLAKLIRNSPIEVLILNGRYVVDQFQYVADCTLDVREMRSWSLPRHKTSFVVGKAFQGCTDEIGGVGIERKILVLGFNHNLQSSFGVTNKVVSEIVEWVAACIRDWNNEQER